MRIVRPGSVVGPQQQYMYLKQLEWVKWGAVDEMRKLQAATAIATTTIVTPATPPAEMDEDVNLMQTTPIAPAQMHAVLPPVTPSRHIASAAAKAITMTPPGQPRKTPVTKRLARDSDEDESDDVLPALRIAPARSKLKISHPVTSRGITSSEQRPTRVTRSTAGALAIRKAGAGASTPASLVRSSGQGPNKIPRLATTRNTSAAKAAAASATHSDSSQQSRPISARRLRLPPPPIPSRLPTLIPSKRPHPTHSSSLSEVANATVKRASTTSDAWMTNNASAVVVPATKSARPGLRSVRRRRSSFSSADVVA